MPRRKFVYRPKDPNANKNGFVEITQEVVEKRAIDAGVLSGRFYENTSTVEGEDIGSRRKHQEYMKRNNLAPADDFAGLWSKETEKRRQIALEGVLPDKSRRDDIGRALYKLYKP